MWRTQGGSQPGAIPYLGPVERWLQDFKGKQRLRGGRKYNAPPAAPNCQRARTDGNYPGLLSTRTTTVNIHRVSSGRNC
jgi:hypothetical protein